MKKITCIIHSLTIGGMERVMSLLLNDFSGRKNVQLDLILIGRTREISYCIPKNITIHSPDFKFNDNKRVYHTIKTIWFIRKTLKKLKPDTILSFGEFWNNLVLLSAYGLPYPIFISDRSQPNKNLGKVQNFLRNTLYPKASGFIAQTQYAAENAKRKDRNKNICAIGNPVRQVIQKSAVYSREKMVLSVGRLIKTKHFDDLIRMFVELDQPDWHLVIVGGNAKRQDQLSELYKLIMTLGAEDKVTLTGEVRNVEEYYQKASIFAFTSSSEGFPNVIGEALSHGIPVVAYDCMAGPSDLIIHNKNGYLVKTHNHKEFKKKMRSLMQDEQRRMELAKNAKPSILKFEQSEIAERFYNCITKVPHTLEKGREKPTE
ncbi:MAG TPA: glycosyltransferase [Aequorivita sp.]|nr:glycosyltransferase [Aequorivita sp.]